MKKLEITKQLISPSIARRYLEQNTHNRKISQPVLLRYTNDMLHGRWKEDTAEPIKISKTGRILDGQHRLQAVIKANRPIYFYVATNIDDSVFDVLDTGKSRNSTDCFTVAGVRSSNTVPSIIAHYNLLEAGRRVGQQIHNKATNAELLQQYYDNELFWQNVTRKARYWYVAFAKILSPAFIGGFYAHFYNLNPSESEIFMNQLCTGVDISNATINLLRNKLMQDKISARKMPPNLKIALIIKTWNHYIMGNTVKILKFDSIRDEFPTAIVNNFL